jgi:hypothetical protein
MKKKDKGKQIYSIYRRGRKLYLLRKNRNYKLGERNKEKQRILLFLFNIYIL